METAGAAGFALAATAAIAAPGYASKVANVRSGPGTTYKVVDQLKKDLWALIHGG